MSEISVMGNKGIHFKFENGYTISIQIGAANYGDNYDAPIGFERGLQKISSTRAEIAIWHDDLKKWYGFAEG